MGEHLLHSLFPATDSRARNVESVKARELHSVVPAIGLGSIHFAYSDAGGTSITNEAGPHDSARETLKSGAKFASFVISGAESGAVTVADERPS
jgi:hypothetical protein